MLSPKLIDKETRKDIKPQQVLNFDIIVVGINARARTVTFNIPKLGVNTLTCLIENTPFDIINVDRIENGIEL